jgi:hypothetical protein
MPNVPPDDTVPCRVQYENRKATDISWGIINILTYIAFLTTGFFVASRSSPRHQTLSNSARGLSDFYMDDAESCCAKSNSMGYVCMLYENTLNDNGNRRLSAGNSTFDGDEGVFDAFIEAPGIILGLLSVVLAVSILWVILLRFFAKPIVIFVEVVKIGLIIFLATVQEEVQGIVFCSILAVLMIGYVYWQRKTILFAADIITHSTISLKENPSILFGSLFVKLFYAGNAGLFVYFFSKSFDAVEIYLTEYQSCDFRYSNYVQPFSTFWGLSYLWTILLLGQMRLSIVATIVGSWHFHPEDMPSTFQAIANLIPSFGTLCVSSLIATIADKVNRMMSRDSWFSIMMLVTWPLDCCMCIFGSCIHGLVKMLTNYAVVLHCFTGEKFIGSARNSFRILSRHFKRGFVTEITSRSLFNLASYTFSSCVALIAWVWIDAEFHAHSLPAEGGFTAILYLLLIIFFVYFPVLGLYVILLLNKVLRESEKKEMNDAIVNGTEPMNTNHLWIPPLAAALVGCISMMFFMFVSNIFLDIITTLFLCFAIDKDNDVDLEGKEFDTIVTQMSDYIGSSASSGDDPEIAQAEVLTAVPVPVPMPLSKS